MPKTGQKKFSKIVFILLFSVDIADNVGIIGNIKGDEMNDKYKCSKCGKTVSMATIYEFYEDSEGCPFCGAPDECMEPVVNRWNELDDMPM